MDDLRWRWLMQAARMHAATFRQKARVVAIEVPPRAARRRGSRWAYVIEVPADASEGRRG